MNLPMATQTMLLASLVIVNPQSLSIFIVASPHHISIRLMMPYRVLGRFALTSLEALYEVFAILP